jgi:chromosome segregation and condensation protein ScpB
VSEEQEQAPVEETQVDPQVEQVETPVEEAVEEASETLDVPLAELRPALEAVLMVADQPLDHVTLASAVGYPPGEVSAALAALAYKQPVSRARVSAIRGVNVDGVMRTLVSRGLVEEAGHDAETTATLYRTTGYFLERIGVTSLEDLPELAPFLPEMGELDDLDARAEAPESA